MLFTVMSPQRIRPCVHCGKPPGKRPRRRGLCSACYADPAVRTRYARKPGGRGSAGAAQEFERPAPEPKRYFDTAEYADLAARKQGYAERAAKSIELFGRKDGLVKTDLEARADFCRFLQNLTLTRRLEHLLIKHGLDCMGLAEQTGLHVRTIYGYLRGDWRPSYRSAVKLGEALDVPADVLLAE